MRVAQSAPRAVRHATWLELFFDLVFVVAVSNLGRLLLDDHSVGGVWVFLGLFVPVWWAWIGISYFVDQFELPELFLRLLMLSQLALALGLALGLEPLVEGRPALFLAAYLAMRLTLTGLYLWAWRRVPGAEELNRKYALAFFAGTGLWLVSLVVDPSLRPVLWGVALALEIAGTIWAYVSTRALPQQVSHMPERFGLFTIIVLGESVLAVATGGSHIEGLGGGVVALCGVLLASFAWWLYFDYADEEVIDRAIRGGRRALYLSFVYGYTHLPVFAGIVAASIGLELFFEEVTHERVEAGARLLLCGGLALFLAALSVVQWAAPRGLPEPVLVARLLATVALMLLGGLGAGLGAVGLLLAVTLTLGVLIVYDTRARPAHPERSPAGTEG